MPMPVGPHTEVQVWVDAAQDADEINEKRLLRTF
jgi:hypothetical protein